MVSKLWPRGPFAAHHPFYSRPRDTTKSKIIKWHLTCAARWFKKGGGGQSEKGGWQIKKWILWHTVVYIWRYKYMRLFWWKHKAQDGWILGRNICTLDDKSRFDVFCLVFFVLFFFHTPALTKPFRTVSLQQPTWFFCVEPKKDVLYLSIYLAPWHYSSGLFRPDWFCDVKEDLTDKRPLYTRCTNVQ